MIHISSEEVQAIVGYAGAGLFALWKAWTAQKQNPPSHTPREPGLPTPQLAQLEAQFQSWRDDQLSMHKENKQRTDAVLKQLDEHRSLLDRILLNLAGIE